MDGINVGVSVGWLFDSDSDGCAIVGPSEGTKVCSFIGDIVDIERVGLYDKGDVGATASGVEFALSAVDGISAC